MATPNSATVSFGDLASTTINFFAPTIADNLTNENALFSALNKSGNVQTYDGGLDIQETMDYAANTNTNSYAGLDTLGVAAQETFTSATFTPAQYATTVIWAGNEVRANMGDARKHNLLKSRIENASRSLKNRLNQDLYGDGTGNGGKNLTGLAAAIPLANTSGIYGGINRALWTWWQNQKFQASVDGAGVVLASAPTLILPMIDRLMMACTRQNDKPDLIIADDVLYSIINAALQTNQRFTDSKSADAGFGEISYKGVRIRRDSSASGIGTQRLFMINTKFLHLRPHEACQFVDLPEKASYNQDAVARTMLWQGNLTCSGQRFQGILSNT